MADWFAYDWEVRGVPAHFTVDLSFAEDGGVYAALLCVSCAARREGAAAFSFRERRRLPRLLERCAALLGRQGRHVGTVALPAQVHYYFYAADARLLVPLYELCTGESVLRMECSKADEPERQTYARFLYPDAAKRQSAANAAFIADRLARGDDVAAPRRIDLLFRFPTASRRAAFSAAAVPLGFVAGRAAFDEQSELPYTLALHANAPLAHAALTALTTRAIRTAEQQQGAFDALDAAFLPKNGPR